VVHLLKLTSISGSFFHSLDNRPGVILSCKEEKCAQSQNRQQYREEPEGDDGVKNPAELACHGEVRQDGGESEVPHDPTHAVVHAPPAAAKEGASPGPGGAKSQPLSPRRSPRQGPAFPHELCPHRRSRRGSGT